MNRRVAVRIFIATAVAASICLPAFAQTQRTQPSASSTAPTESSTSATSATTDNYFVDPFYSAIMPTETTNPQAPALGDQDQAKLRIEAKGYSNISGLQKDGRGIWRGKATLKDGRSVDVVLDLEGNIYSVLNP
jgi:hypothetical protein